MNPPGTPGGAPRQLSLSQARRLTLASQGFLDSPDRRGVNRRDLRRMMRTLKLLQLDSIPIITRTQYMPAFSRLGPYEADLLDEIAYRRDEWFEAWAHEASLVPVGLEPHLRWLKERAVNGIGRWKSMHAWAAENGDLIDNVRAQVADRGPMLASELHGDERRTSSSGWGSSRTGAVALSWLLRIGELGVRRVGNFEKQYALLGDIVPGEILAEPTPAYGDALKELLMQAADAFGVGTADDFVDYFRLPARDAKPLIDELAEDGRLEPVRVEGWSRPAWKVPDRPIPRRKPDAALLSPFDPVVWFRPRDERLFDFHYRIEIYVPAEKRVWGYYVLPFLMGERIVGRVDVKTDRTDGVLRVPAAHIEEHADPSEVAPALAAQLRRLATFVGVSGDVLVGRQGNLASALRAEVA